LNLTFQKSQRIVRAPEKVRRTLPSRARGGRAARKLNEIATGRIPSAWKRRALLGEDTESEAEGLIQIKGRKKCRFRDVWRTLTMNQKKKVIRLIWPHDTLLKHKRKGSISAESVVK